MKLNIIAALLLCASVATAASETTTTASATTEAHGKSADAPAHGKKKAKKKAKKEEKKEGARVAPAANTTAQAQVAPAPAAAAAISTAVAPAAQAPAKKWGVTLLNESSVDYAGGKDIGRSTISTTNYIGASYKITATEKLGLRQYYTYDHDQTSEKNFESSDIKQSFTVATLGTKTKGILGSDDIAPVFWYYMPGHTAEINNFGHDMDDFYGILRADVEIAWTLNPKWTVSYYLNPRQTLGAKTEFTKENGKPGSFEASSRLIHYGYVYYNQTDATQFYGYAGFDHKMTTATMTSTSDTYLSGVGIYSTFFGGKLALNPEVAVATPTKSAGVATAEQELYKKENISYVLATVISL